MNRGYIKLWRKSLDSGMMQNPKLWTFWTWCLQKAAYQETKQMVGFQEITLQPGQFIFGRKKAAKELKMSEQSIRTCLDLLIKSGNLTIQATNKFSVVTVINWPLYQSDQIKSTSKQPASNQQTLKINQQSNQQNIPPDARIEGVRKNGEKQINQQSNQQDLKTGQKSTTIKEERRKKIKNSTSTNTPSAKSAGKKSDKSGEIGSKTQEQVWAERLERLQVNSEQGFNRFWLAYYEKFEQLPAWPWTNKETYRVMNELLKEVFIGDIGGMLEAWTLYLDDNSLFEQERGKAPRYFRLDIEKYRHGGIKNGKRTREYKVPEGLRI